MSTNRQLVPLIDRMLAKITPEANGCWEWQGSRAGGGYGEIFLYNVDGKSKKAAAHRAMYEWLVGPIPKGLQLDHLCRNRSCVNPSHLEPVTNKENSLRGVSSNAINARKTECKHGHDLTIPGNVYIHPKRGHRHCAVCMKIRNDSRYGH